MRVLLISDIHSNLEALEACMEAFPACDHIANLGDVVGYGASPNAVVEQVREFDGIRVRGNHDRAACGLLDVHAFNPIAGFAAMWTREELTSDNRLWIRDLPEGPIHHAGLPEVQFVHGSPIDEDEYILNEPSAMAALHGSDRRITFFGHTHMQGLISLFHSRLTQTRPTYRHRDDVTEYSVPLDPARKYLINPGSVGQPRDGDWRAGFALYDSDAAELTFFRVPYDIDGAQQRILHAGLPERLALRLREGR